MAEHLSPETIGQYRGGTLQPAEMLAADDHLALCDACRERAGEEPGVSLSSAMLFQTIARGTHAEHCDYDTLEAYVDGRLGGFAAGAVDAHLAHCGPCREDVGDLRQARAMVQLDTDRTARRGGVASLLAGLWPHRWAGLVAGLAAAGLVLWLAGILRPDHSPSSSEVAQNAVLSPVEVPAPESSPPPVSAPAAIVTLRDGSGEVVLHATGELAGVPVLSSAAQRAVVTALTTGRMTVLATASLTAVAGSLRSGSAPDAAFGVVEPVGRVIEASRPTFRWTPHPDASGYRVAVFDLSFNEVASSEELADTTWVPPALPRGRTYVWQVTARTPDGPVQAPVPPAAEARFAVLDDEHAAEIARVRRAASGSHLTLAVLYARTGLREEAERELDALARLNPESALARDLLASVRTSRLH